ncbi:conserved hypothetical protein [Paraburkholderia tropica]
MFNRSDAQQISEERIADIERVVTQHGEMLNALKDHLIAQIDDVGAIFSALSTAIFLMQDDQREALLLVLSGIVRDSPDQQQAAKMRKIFQQRLLLELPD